MNRRSWWKIDLIWSEDLEYFAEISRLLMISWPPNIIDTIWPCEVLLRRSSSSSSTIWHNMWGSHCELLLRRSSSSSTIWHIMAMWGSRIVSSCWGEAPQAFHAPLLGWGHALRHQMGRPTNIHHHFHNRIYATCGDICGDMWWYMCHLWWWGWWATNTGGQGDLR